MSTLLSIATAAAANEITPMLLVLVCGIVALFFVLQNNKRHEPAPQPQMPPMMPPWMMQPPPAPVAAAPSAELRAMQDTLRMLLESQQRQQQQQQQQAVVSYSSPNRSQQRVDEPESPANSGSLTRAPSQSSSSAATPATSVPYSLLQDLQALQDNVRNLERKNRDLNRQLTLTEVSNVVDLEKKYRIPIPVLAEAGASAVQGIQQLNLSASEIETIRAIFNMFDTAQTGQISTQELRALHKQLGEPLTDDEASAAVSELDQEGTGSVNFNKFLIWWYHGHTQGKKGSAYTQRFKLMHAKLTTSEFNVDKVITQDSGEVFTLEYRLNFYYKSNSQSLRPISPWHDIPLNRVGSGEQGQLFNFVCEIPKWTRAKFECATGELYNPIKQDTQHGKLRYYKHGDMMFNYGFFPQTWEDPEVIPPDTGCPGDNDPIDCVEIGATQIRVGAITAVKILGLLGLIDDGETDWKCIAISISDPMAHLLNDVDDVELHLPGAIKAIREYFRDYKSFSGTINTYALRAQAMPRHYAIKVLEETHQHWKSLHLVKKRDTIGESSTQAELRLIGSAVMAGTPLPQHAQGMINAAASLNSSSSSSPRIPAGLAGSLQATPAASPRMVAIAPSPRLAAAAMASASPRIGGAVVKPVGGQELSGMEQPLDKLMAGN